MLKVAVIGSGNVAQHLIRAFGNAVGVTLVQACARHPEKLSRLLPPEQITSDPGQLAAADIYVIAVTDDAIAALASQLPFRDRLVVHTSGSLPMEQLDPKNRRGVFYPLQTFSKARELDFGEVPLCLEGENPADHQLLEQLARAVSRQVFSINSAQRQALHVAAVFANNFTNHLYAQAAQICSDSNIPFDILKPLILETAAKVQKLSPLQAQTGPAIRRDSDTLQRHLDFLKDVDRKTLYKILTHSIQKTDGQKL